MGLLLGAMLLSALGDGSESFNVDSISAGSLTTWDDPVGRSLKNRVKKALENVSYNERSFFNAVNKCGEVPDRVEVYQSQAFEIEKRYKV